MSRTHMEALSANVRRLREVYQLSLSQLSEQSGIAKATLFKIERGRTNPTLETLTAIAETFEVSVPALIAVAPEVSVEVLHDGEGEDISDDASIGRVLRSQVVTTGTLEIHAQTFHAGKAETSASHGDGAREHIFVRSGKIRVGPIGLEREISAGDYATYPADRTHRWEAVDGPASIWIVHSFPRGGGSHLS